MAEIRILQIEPIARRAGEPTGEFAMFTCDLGPVRMAGCTLRMKPDGSIATYPPRGRGSRAVTINDHHVYAMMTEAACAAYRAAGGVLPADDA